MDAGCAQDAALRSKRLHSGLSYKRLEHGQFRFPQAETKQELSLQVFQLLLDGIALGGRH